MALARRALAALPKQERSSAGKLVNEVRTAVAERAGRDLPVLEATPDTLEDVLTHVLDGRSAVAGRP